jgi:FkbM family methyltransferase
MKRVRQYLRKALLSLIPSSSPFIYRLARRYVALHDGDNDCNMQTNGEFRFMRWCLPQCETVFDIGANVGEWTALALTINPRAIIHCFEPSSSAYARLVSRGFPGTVVCNNFGISSARREARLFVFEECSGNNSLYQRQGLESFGLSTQQRVEAVRLETLDQYCLERGIGVIHFAKVDVEGHELEVFKGMTRLISSGQVRVVQFEYGGCNIDSGVLLKDIFAFFKDFPYSFYKIHPRQVKLVPKYDQRLENFQYQNWAVIKRDWSFAG